MYHDMKAKDLWKQATQNRQNYLDRARDASLLTIPQLYPPEGSDSDTKYPTPYQSLGSKGVNNLANKVILSLFPPSQAFFKLGLSPADIKASGKSEGDVQNAMYGLEKSIINEMEVSSLRPKLVGLVKQLIVGGSSILHVPKKGMPEVFKLEEFGIKRDRKGNVLLMVIKENISYKTLPKNAKEDLNMAKVDIPEECRHGKKKLEMYTCIVRTENDKFDVWQEIHDVKIQSTIGSYKAQDLPYLFVPFVDSGEDFGRSYVEDFIGDLQSYEGLRQSLLEAAAESARIVYTVKPNSTLSLKKLEKAKSGDVLLGDKDDVGIIQADKRIDMSVTQRESDTIKQDLSVTFLLDSAVRRNAERVTAEEIRQVSQELEVALGGIYSTLSNNLQAPLVRLYMNRLVAKGMLNPVIKNSAKLEITTGSAALGRGADYRTITTFVSTITQLTNVPNIDRYLRIEELVKRLAYSLDINITDLVISEDQRNEMDRQIQEAEIESKTVPEVIKQQNKAQLQQE